MENMKTDVKDSQVNNNFFRNLTRPWQPKKTTKTSQSVVREDTEFAKRVEEIIKKTQPGSEEEMFMIMFSKSSRIQRSPTKTTE